MLSALSGISENVWEGYVCLFSQWGRFIFHFAELIDRCSYWQDEAIDTDILFSAGFIKAQKYRKKSVLLEEPSIFSLACEAIWVEFNSSKSIHLCLTVAAPRSRNKY